MNKKLLLSIFFTIIYAIITIIAVLHHEIWADEAQVWLLCKNLSFSQLIHHLHNEGHPALFYLLVMPFAKLSNNIIYMQLICWGFMCLSVFLLIYKSPFSNIVKLAILSSAGFLYFLPVIARSYSIIPFLVFLAAMLYSKRKEKPILYAIVIFLIVNTHAIMLGFGVILFLLFIIENYKNRTKNNIIAAVIMLIGFLLLIFQLHDTTSSNVCLGTLERNGLLLSVIKVSSFFFINAYNKMITIDKTLYYPLISIPILLTMITTFILFFINLFRNNKKLFFIAISGIGFQYLIYILTYSAHTYVTRIFSALVIILFCFWVLFENDENFIVQRKFCSKKSTTILLTIFFALTCYNGINFHILEKKYDYSGAKKTAEYIINNAKPNDLILIDNEPYTLAVAYYLKNIYTLFSVIRNKPFKYQIWDEYTKPRLTNDIWLQLCKQINNEYQEIFIIRPINDEKNKYSNLKDLSVEYNKNFKLVFESGYTIEQNERYKIYKFLK